MAKPRALVLTGYGINCDEETRFAFDMAGADAQIMHVNDLIEKPGELDFFEILVFPGGFSYGDDTGSGRALATKISHKLADHIHGFILRDTLILGICNGFQVMANLGIVPGHEETDMLFRPSVALDYNSTFRYQCRWVDLKINKSCESVFTRGIESLHLPVAHGEGNFFAPEKELSRLEQNNQVSMRYCREDLSGAAGEFPWNPNGSMNDIASITDKTGRVMGMMPHPERAIFFTQRDDWTLQREKMKRQKKEIPDMADGIKIFENAVNYYN